MQNSRLCQKQREIPNFSGSDKKKGKETVKEQTSKNAGKKRKQLRPTNVQIHEMNRGTAESLFSHNGRGTGRPARGSQTQLIFNENIQQKKENILKKKTVKLPAEQQ